MLISDEHRSQETKRHMTDPEYGGESIAYANNISTIINNLGIEDVLDYGAGKGELPKNLVLDHRVKVHLYDPAIPAISESPEPHDMVVCANVLEYVEDKYVDAVLDDLKRCTKRIGFISVKGELDEWLPRIMSRFSLESAIRTGDEFFAIVSLKDEH